MTTDEFILRDSKHKEGILKVAEALKELDAGRVIATLAIYEKGYEKEGSNVEIIDILANPSEAVITSFSSKNDKEGF